MFQTAAALVLSGIMFVINSVSSVLPWFVPETKNENELEQLTEMFADSSLANEVVVVQNGDLTKDERSAIICLQGLVGRTEGSIFINYGNDSETELKETENAGSKLLYTDENGNNWTLESLLNRYSSHIKDNGYVLFTDSDTHGQINTAFNFATVYGWLAVPVSCEATVKKLGMKKCEDLTDDEIDFTLERDFYLEHKDEFRKDSLVHLNADAYGLRDFAVQQKIFITYVEDDDAAAKTFREQLLRDLEPASVVLGWCQDELEYTKHISSFGHYVIPSDHSFNMSILNSLDCGDVQLGTETEAVKPDESKHYVSIVYSDGDNAQWISNGYREFYTWQSYDISVPVTWTFAPSMNEFSPVAVKKASANAGDDSFITGPSGAGYGRISKMSAKELKSYSDLTAATMLDTGLTTVTILDEIPENFVERCVFKNKLSYFARYDNIKGGILQLDPDRYASGAGCVYFAKEKPFISVGFSLWHPSGNADEVTNEWLKEQAEIVNSYPADIDSINGYTVINVHPWTVGPDDLAYFVSCLDSNIEVISADALITAVAENVPHKYAETDR